MPRFAANLSLMFNEWPFLDRFDAAAQAGFTAVEFLFPYDYAPADVAARLKRNGLTQALFNLPPGDWAAGERGMASFAERFTEVQEGIATALPYAKATGVKRLHLMAGKSDRHDPRHVEAFRTAVMWAARELADHGIELLLEPLNGRDNPGYFLDDFAFAAAMIRDIGAPNVKLQFDIYHRQIMHGDVLTALREMMPIIGHVQVASVPLRHEPMSEELNDAAVFAELDRLGYTGFVGCEYRPRSTTLDGLGWFAPYRDSQRVAP